MIPIQGCSLTLYEHLLPGVDDNGPLGGTGIFHTFTSGNSENENLADLGLANNVSSYTCTCKLPIEFFFVFILMLSVTLPSELTPTLPLGTRVPKSTLSHIMQKFYRIQ